MLQPASAPLSPPDRAHRAVRHADPAGAIPGRWLVASAAASFALLVAMMAWEQLRVDPWARSTLALAGVAVLAATTRFALRRPRTRAQRVVRDVTEYFGLFALISIMGATATYPLSAGSRGFVDPALQRIDALLRFNWTAWYAMVAAHRSLQLLGTMAYQSIFLTPAILLGYFAWAGRRAEARAFVATFWLAAVIALLLFPFFPARGPLACLWHGPIPYMPESALYQASLIPELRDHALRHVDLGALRGLVSAPSFHTVSAVLYVATAWPVRRLRWPVALLNAAMLLATPVEGTHYLADMIAGLAVALAALAAMRKVRIRLVRRAGAEPAHSGTGMDLSNVGQS